VSRLVRRSFHEESQLIQVACLPVPLRVDVLERTELGQSTKIRLTEKIGAIASTGAALLGRPVAEWSVRPPLPTREPPRRYDLGGGISLWRLPVGYVRIRERHREMPNRLAEAPDGLRFPLMMADKAVTGWLDCTAWLIRHPQTTILVDTGESASFGSDAYFAGIGQPKRRLYPRILDGAAPPGGDLAAGLREASVETDEIDLCVLTHLHSDHIGNLDRLGQRARFLVAREETRGASGSGRLPEKLPRDGRVEFTAPSLDHPVFGKVQPLTAWRDILVAPTPGHTAGHQSVVIDCGDRQIVLAGDAAFGDDQVAHARIPGIVEDAGAVRETYAKLLALRQMKPTIALFSHDPRNREKLTAYERAPAANRGLLADAMATSYAHDQFVQRGAAA